MPDKPPDIGEMFGFMLDTLFMEGLHADLERVERTNALLDHLQECPMPLGLRRIQTLLMLPRSDPTRDRDRPPRRHAAHAAGAACACSVSQANAVAG